MTLPGLYWQHYYLLPIAGVAIGVAVCLTDAVAAIGQALRSKDASRRGPATVFVRGELDRRAHGRDRIDALDSGSRLSDGRTRGADDPLQRRAAMGRVAGAGPRARPADDDLGRSLTSTSGAGKAR